MNAPTNLKNLLPASHIQQGTDVVHESAHLHVSGAATYIDDIPEHAGTLYAALILSPVARLAGRGWSGVGAVSAGGVGGEPLPSLTLLWQDDYLRWRLLWSVLQATLTCGVALLMGVPLAWVLARFEFWGRELTLRLLMLPFVVPTLVAALCSVADRWASCNR